MKCIGGQIKAFSFLFCTVCDTKSTIVGERYVQSGERYVQGHCETTTIKRTDSSNVFKGSGKVRKGSER